MRLALSLVLAAVAATPTVALQAPAFVLPSRAGASRAQYSPRRVAVRMEEAAPTSYEEYLQKRIDAGEDIESAYSDLGQDIDFDGGDSGSGAVGDGKMTLDDQHNSPFIVGSGSASDGALGTQNAATAGDPFAGRGVKAAVNARDAKQKNYWGRQVGTGYADALEDDARYASRPVLRQQLENWQNQQQLKRATDGQVESQSTFYGVVQEDPSRYRKDMGRPIDSMRSEIHVDTATSAERLDGGEWGPVTVPANVVYEEEHEMYGTPTVPGVLDLKVLNELSSFAPFRVSFTPDSPSSMTVSPTEGVMEKRDSLKTTDLVVRFNPSEYGIPVIGELVFETEDFKKVFKVVGMTAHHD